MREPPYFTREEYELTKMALAFVGFRVQQKALVLTLFLLCFQSNVWYNGRRAVSSPIGGKARSRYHGS